MGRCKTRTRNYDGYNHRRTPRLGDARRVQDGVTPDDTTECVMCLRKIKILRALAYVNDPLKFVLAVRPK